MSCLKIFVVPLCALLGLSVFSHSPTNRILESVENGTSSLLIDATKENAKNSVAMKNQNINYVTFDVLYRYHPKTTSIFSFAQNGGSYFNSYLKFDEKTANAIIGDEIIDVSTINDLVVVSSLIGSFKQKSFLPDSITEVSYASINKRGGMFTGLDINPKMYRRVYEQFLMMGDRITHRYIGLSSVILATLKYTAPAFIAKCEVAIMKLINPILSMISLLGDPYHILVRAITCFVALSVTDVIANMIWAGHHNKGFRIGIVWKWPLPYGVYEHYD